MTSVMSPLTLAWTALIVAGLFEIGWPIGFKLTSHPDYQILGWVIALITMSVSGFLLWYAQKTIPMGTAYAVWTGIGGAGTFLVGVICFGDVASITRFVGVALILSGVILLKLASSS